MNNVIILGFQCDILNNKLFKNLKPKIEKNKIIYEYELITKYYTSNINFHIFNLDDEHVDYKNTFKNCQSIIYIVDSIKKFNYIKKFHTTLKNELEHDSFETNLIGGIELEADKSFKMWCIDEKFEFIKLTNETQTSSFKNETFSQDRIIEALSCTAWPSMEMNKKKKSIDKVKITKDITTVKEKVLVKDKEEIEFSNEKYFKDLINGIEPEISEIEDDLEFEMNNLDSLFTKINALKLNQNNLKHEDRKLQAETLALSLFDIMNKFDEDKDETEVEQLPTENK